MLGMRHYTIGRAFKKLFFLMIRYPLELIGVSFFCIFLRLLSFDHASNLGGWIGRKIGPKLKVSWVARYNLMKAFPEKTPAEIDAIVVDMWDNLMRTFFEYPHLRYLCNHPSERIEYVHLERCEQLRDDGNAGIFYGAHLGNWEIGSVLANKISLPLHRIYRSANNPYVEWVFRYFRAKIPGVLIPKGMPGFRKIVSLMKRGGHFAMLSDQKLNEGIEVDFFGYPAMTAPSMAHLALKFGYPILPIRSERLDGARFRLTTEEIIVCEKSDDMDADVAAVMAQTNRILEGWIREKPAQWLWVHKRWEDSKTMWKELYKNRKQWKAGVKPPEVFAAATKGRHL